MTEIDHDRIFSISPVWVVIIIAIVPALALGALIALAIAANA